MSDNVITFPEPARRFPRRRAIPTTNEPENEDPAPERAQRWHTSQWLLFRSRASILESN
jgi:hypothetical protein